jgi:hypothetical protein
MTEPNLTGHGQIVCEACGGVIVTCRCAAAHAVIAKGLCRDCRAKAKADEVAELEDDIA